MTEQEQINDQYKPTLTLGQKAADLLTAFIGTWAFLLGQSFIIYWWITHQGIPPIINDNSELTFINLCMSIQAAEAFVIVLISQNRQAQRDRAIMGQINHTLSHVEELVAAKEMKNDKDK